MSAIVHLEVHFENGQTSTFDIQEGGSWYIRDDMLYVKPHEHQGPPRFQMNMSKINGIGVTRTESLPEPTPAPLPRAGEYWYCKRQYQSSVKVLRVLPNSMYKVQSRIGTEFEAHRDNLTRPCTAKEIRFFLRLPVKHLVAEHDVHTLGWAFIKKAAGLRGVEVETLLNDVNDLLKELSGDE